MNTVMNNDSTHANKRRYTIFVKLADMFVTQVRGFALVGILILLALVFQLLTGGTFLSARNLTNLGGQVAITAILASGIVLVMIPGYIDLSIGSAVAFEAVLAAIFSGIFGLSFWPTVALVLGAGLLIGAWQGFWTVWLGVPAFIVTLASLLGLRGLTYVITGSQTITPGSELLVFSGANLPTSGTVILPLLLWAGFAALRFREWRARVAANVSTSLVVSTVLPLVFSGIVTIAAIGAMVSYRGMPLSVAIVLVLFTMAGFVLQYTAFGRRLYAIGGNREAAKLAGINLRFHGMLVFAGMGVLYGLAGLVLVSRLFSAAPGAEVGLELHVIAAAVIGGTSLMGGRGTVLGAVLGALLLESLANGMSLMNLPTSYQSIAIGLVLLFAVYVDIRGQGAGARLS